MARFPARRRSRSQKDNAELFREVVLPHSRKAPHPPGPRHFVKFSLRVVSCWKPHDGSFKTKFYPQFVGGEIIVVRNLFLPCHRVKFRASVPRHSFILYKISFYLRNGIFCFFSFFIPFLKSLSHPVIHCVKSSLSNGIRDG